MWNSRLISRYTPSNPCQTLWWPRWAAAGVSPSLERPPPVVAAWLRLPISDLPLYSGPPGTPTGRARPVETGGREGSIKIRMQSSFPSVKLGERDRERVPSVKLGEREGEREFHQWNWERERERGFSINEIGKVAIQQLWKEQRKATK